MFSLRTIVLLGIVSALTQPTVRCADFIGGISSSRVLESDSGVVNLEWAGADEATEVEFELEKSNDSDFSDAQLIYKGRDQSTHLTGLREGEYFFRVRESGESRWSEPLRVKVQFISRDKLFALLGVGFVVCIFTAAAIFQGHMSRGTA